MTQTKESLGFPGRFSSFISMRYVYFSFVAQNPIADPSIAYSIKTEANLQNWIFINDGESLVLKADDQIVPLKGPGSAGGREVSSMGVQEIAYWSFSLETLKKLAAAKTIQFRVYGSKGQLTGTFTDRMMQELRFFAQEAPGLIKDPTAVTAASSVPSSPSASETATPASAAAPIVPPKP
ncbi:MAG: hypothetical protein ACREXR_02485 [Gammaproteobacteria bacterium]